MYLIAFDMASEMEVWAEQWDADGADWHTSSAEPNDDLVEVYDKLVVNAGEGYVHIHTLTSYLHKYS